MLGRLGVKISIIIVLATPITPIPAVTLKHKTIHKNKIVVFLMPDQYDMILCNH